MLQGSIQDRLWGKTLGALGRRAVTGQLTIRSKGDTYAMVFADGYVVAASTPGAAATVLGLALAQELLDITQVAELEHHPDREHILATIFQPDQLRRLRRQAIAAATTRTFTLAEGDFTFDAEVTLPVAPDTAMHIGGLIYHGVMSQLDDQQLIAAVGELGSTFRTRTDGMLDLPYLGFVEAELAVVRALVDGLSLSQIDQLSASERRTARATIYTLASLGALHCEAPPRSARGTVDPGGSGSMPRMTAAGSSGGMQRVAITRTSSPGMPRPAIARTSSPGMPRPAIARTSSPGIPHPPSSPSIPRTISNQVAPPTPNPDEAATHYGRGQAALRDERFDDAITALLQAIERAPDNHDYKCALAWARFVGAGNKPAAAAAARAILAQVAIKAERPVLAYYYLGMIERIVGRTPQALGHFQQVLELDPSHREAKTELRFLSRSSGPIKR